MGGAGIRDQQIRAVESVSGLGRVFLIASIAVRQVRASLKARRRDPLSGLDIGDEGKDDRTARGYVRASWLVQGYLLLLAVTEVVTWSVMVLLTSYSAYVLSLVVAKRDLLAGFPAVKSVLLVGKSMSDWAVPAVSAALVTAADYATGALGGLNGSGEAAVVTSVAVAITAAAYWIVSRVLRASLVANARQVI